MSMRWLSPGWSGTGLTALALLGCGGSDPTTALVDTADPWAHLLEEEPDAQEAAREAESPLTADTIQPVVTRHGDAGAAPDAILIAFARQVFEVGQVGAALPAGSDVQIEPPVPGSWEVLSTNAARFKPDVGFAAGRSYNVSLRAIGTRGGVFSPPEGSSWSSKFQTPDLRLLRASPVAVSFSGRTIDQDDNTGFAPGSPTSMGLELVFSGPVEARTVAERLALAIDGKEIPAGALVGVEGHPNRLRVDVGGELLAGPLGRVSVRAGFASTVDTSAGVAGEATFPLLFEERAVEVLAVTPVEGGSSFGIEVVCNDEASEGYKRWMWSEETGESYRTSPRCTPSEASIREHVVVTPAVPFTVAPSRGGFRLVGKFQRGPVKIELRPGLRTVDGGVLQVAYEKDVMIQPLKPTLAFSTQGRYLPRDAWVTLPIQHRNLETLQVRVRHVPERNLMFWMTGANESADSRVADEVASTTLSVRGDVDARATSWVDLKSLVPDAKKGVYEVTISGGGASASARLLLTDLNLVAKAEAGAKSRRIQVWALGMRDGAPLSGVEVQAVRPSGKVLATCMTGSSGCVLEIPGVGDEFEPVALIARRGDDLTYLKFDELQTEVSEEHVQGEPYTSDRPYRASVYVDRGVYRPGDTAHLAGLVRTKDHVAPPAGMPVDVEVVDPRGKVIRTLSARTNEAGMFVVDVAFADYATTGTWRAHARAGKKALGSVSFAVEEFVPERMEVEARATRAAYLKDEAVDIAAKARYLFGGSAADHDVELSCRVVPVTFKPKNNNQYTYGEGSQGKRPVELGRVTGTLGEEGAGDLRCPPFAHGAVSGFGELVADVAVFEAGSGRTSTATARVPVHSGKTYVGLATSAKVAKSGSSMTLDGVVVDWDGNPVPGKQKIQVSIQELQSEYGWFFDDDGESWRVSQRAVPVDSIEVDVVDGRFKLDWTPASDAEKFRFVAEAGEARTSIDVLGEQRWWWWEDGEQRKDITPRPLKATQVTVETPPAIGVGERTEVTINSPFQGRALVTLETDKVLRSEWIQVTAGPQKWSFTLGEFADNVYVSAMVIKDPHLESREAFLPDRAFGVASIEVRPTQFTGQLKVSVPNEVRSGSELKVNLDLGPGKGKRFVTVAAVDEGILSLTDFETPDPFDSLFPTRALGVTTWETVGWGLHLQAPGPSRRTGGDAEGGVSGRVQMTKPVSLWSGLVEVPEDGKAVVAFDVPRYRGKLRVMAVSAGVEKIAAAEAQVTVRDPVVLQTTLPRFLIEGDKAEIPVFLTNTSGKDRQVTVELDAYPLEVAAQKLAERKDGALVFEGGRQTTLLVPDGESRTVVFRAKNVASAGGLRLDVVAKSEDLTVSETLDVPVHHGGPRTRRTTQVELGQGPVDLTAALDGWVPGTERSTVWVTPNPYGTAFSHLSYVVRYPYGCIEQTTSSTRPLLYVGNLLEATDPDLVAKGKVEHMVQSGIDRLMNMQTSSGGFAYWTGGSEPTVWGSAYATHLLLDAKEAGFEVPSDNLDDAIAYLDRVAAGSESATDPYNHGAPGGAAYTHYVLARAGKARNARMQELLVEVGTPTTGEEQEAVYLLKAGLYLAGDRRYEKDLRAPDVAPLRDERINGWSYYSDLRRRGFQLSVYTDLFGAEGADVQARVVASGLERSSSRNYTTQEIAWGMTGLGKIIQKGAKDFDVKLQVAGRDVKPASYQQGAAETTWSLWRASELPGVALSVQRRGAGKLYAVVQSEGVREGSSWTYGGQSLSVSREYLTLSGQKVNLSDIRLGETIYAKVTVSNKTASRIQNLALVDRFPAGWEIENPRLGRGGSAEWVNPDNAWEADNLEVRDDRLEVFGALAPDQTVEVVYVLRAVTAGSFTLPPVEIEAMYDPSVWARAPGGTVRVFGAWEGYYL